VKQFLGLARKERSKERIKHQRKHPEKWQDYLEIWDLKDGYQPWIDLGDGIKAPRWKKMNRPWTYYEIAKYKYPYPLSPRKQDTAIEKIKKQYRAAYKLICGEKYDPVERKKRADAKKEEILCPDCPEREYCTESCPALERAQARIELAQMHYIPLTPVTDWI
jgi:hypothetical protein